MKRIVWISKTDEESWILMPRMLRRVYRFTRERDSDGIPGHMSRQLQLSFAMDDPDVVAIAFVEGIKLFGHVLASCDEWSGKKYVTVLQYELDDAAPRKLAQDAIEMLERWGVAKQAVAIQGLALDEKIARLYRTFFGFKNHRILVRRPVQASVATEAPSAMPEAATIEGNLDGERSEIDNDRRPTS